MSAFKKRKRAYAAGALKWALWLLVLSVPVTSFAGTRLIPKPRPSIYKLALRDALFTNPPDTTINACGTSVVLTSKTIPGYSNLIWNDGSTATTKTVTASGTYWWEVTGTSVVTNGNFSSGDTGFSSSYSDKTTGHPNQNLLVPEGTYAVDTNPNAYHSAFTQFGDHTTGSGNMLIVNGASAANVVVWKQNINIIANTDYVFSVWVTSVTPSNPAVLQFSINGSALGSAISLNGALADGTWQFFTTTWNSGSASGSVPISLINQNTASGGNDFAIDDVVFAPVYRQNVIVNLNPIPVLAVTGPHSACNTYDLAGAITGYNTSTYTYIYKDSSGTILPGSSVTLSGTYTIIETNKTTGCQSLPQTVTVTINPTPTKPGITAL